jgi:hypothetical protein
MTTLTLRLAAINHAVAEVWEIPMTSLGSKRRTQQIVDARCCAIHFAGIAIQEFYGRTCAGTLGAFYGITGNAVTHCRKRHANWLATDTRYREMVGRVGERLK